MPQTAHKKSFDEDMAHDYIASHGFGVPTEEGLKVARMLFDNGDEYADIGHEVVARALTIEPSDDS
jgi:hypothetical protein